MPNGWSTKHSVPIWGPSRQWSAGYGATVAKAEEAARKDLSLDEILRVACELINRESVEAFTMRRLAEQLGRSTMATYRHVGNKDELLLAAADSVLARVQLPDTAGVPWNERFHALALATWAEIENARWIPGYLVSRQVTPPSLVRLRGALAEIVLELGLPKSQVDKIVVMSGTFTIGLVATVRDPEPYLRFGVDLIADGLEAQAVAAKMQAKAVAAERK